MKKLFAICALALTAVAFTSCQTENKPAALVFSADKTEATTGDKIIFSLTGPTEGIQWGICDYESCMMVKFVDNKYTYTVKAPTENTKYDKDTTFFHYFYAQDLGTLAKTDSVKIKITLKAEAK